MSRGGRVLLVPAAALLGLLLCPAVARAQPRVSVDVGPRPAEVGLLMQVILTVAGDAGADCTLSDVPQVDGARLTLVQGPSTSNFTEIRNGRLSQSITTRWVLELVPERPGLLDLPPLHLTCRGQEVVSDPVPLSVQPSTVEPGVVRVAVTPSASKLWVGQLLTMEVEVSIAEKRFDDLLSRNWYELSLPWLESVPQLALRDIPPPSCRDWGHMVTADGKHKLPTCQTREIVDGEPRLVFRQTIPLMTTGAGTVTLPDSRFSARLVLESKVQRDPLDPFDIFGSRSRSVPTRVVMADAWAPGPTLEIEPAPAEGQPPVYTNAVGRFRFSARADPTDLAVGESCHLHLTQAPAEPGPAGRGNLDYVDWPSFEDRLTDFRLFGKDETRTDGSRTLELEISPRNDRVTAIPALSFASFDPEAGRYESLTTDPIPLEVRSGGEDGLTTDLATPQELLNDLETIRDTLPPADGHGPPAWLGWALGLVVLAGVELRLRARRWRAAHPGRGRRRGARRRLTQALEAADAPSAVAAAFSRYLADRLGGPPAGLTAEEAAARLPDRELGTEIVSVVSRWEAAYLGGARLETGAARDDAARLADRIEEVA